MCVFPSCSHFSFLLPFLFPRFESIHINFKIIRIQPHVWNRITLFPFLKSLIRGFASYAFVYRTPDNPIQENPFILPSSPSRWLVIDTTINSTPYFSFSLCRSEIRKNRWYPFLHLCLNHSHPSLRTDHNSFYLMIWNFGLLFEILMFGGRCRPGWM